jgi:hypothetical protein
MDELDTIVLTDEIRVQLRAEQTRLIKIIEAYAKLEDSKEWELLKELVFSKSLAAIERQMLNEAISPEIKTDKLYRLQGEWAWAKQYNDTGRFVEALKRQLEEIKRKFK